MISSWASASGLPVSVCTSSASRARYRVRWDFQASSRCRRCRGVSPAHQAAASCARLTAVFTSASPHTGKVPMTSAVAGLSVSNVAADCAGPGVQVVVAIGLTVIDAGGSCRRRAQ